MTRMSFGLVACFLVCCAFGQSSSVGTDDSGEDSAKLNLGNFSISLAVKDLKASREFYEQLGFHATGFGGANWRIMQNETATIGLFQGMLPQNTLTFNPGWDRNATALPEFDDVRDIQRSIQERGLALTTSADESSTGPASFMLVDPDGNPILVDQHIPRPRK